MILLLALIVLAVVVFLAWQVLSRPASLLAPTNIHVLPEQTALAPALPVPDEVVLEDERLPLRAYRSRPIILNILLMGIDTREDGITTSGTIRTRM